MSAHATATHHSRTPNASKLCQHGKAFCFPLHLFKHQPKSVLKLLRELHIQVREQQNILPASSLLISLSQFQCFSTGRSSPGPSSHHTSSSRTTTPGCFSQNQATDVFLGAPSLPLLVHHNFTCYFLVQIAPRPQIPCFFFFFSDLSEFYVRATSACETRIRAKSPASDHFIRAQTKTCTGHL